MSELPTYALSTSSVCRTSAGLPVPYALHGIHVHPGHRPGQAGDLRLGVRIAGPDHTHHQPGSLQPRGEERAAARRHLGQGPAVCEVSERDADLRVPALVVTAARQAGGDPQQLHGWP